MAVMNFIMPIGKLREVESKESYLLKVSMYVDNTRGSMLSDLWCNPTNTNGSGGDQR